MKKILSASLFVFTSFSFAQAADLKCTMNEEIFTKTHRTLASNLIISGKKYEQTITYNGKELTSKGTVKTFEANPSTSEDILKVAEESNERQSKLFKEFAESIAKKDGLLIVEESGDHPTIIAFTTDKNVVAINLKYGLAQTGICE